MTALHAMIKKYVLPNSRMEYNQMNLSFNVSHLVRIFVFQYDWIWTIAIMWNT